MKSFHTTYQFRDFTKELDRNDLEDFEGVVKSKNFPQIINY